MRSVFFQVLAGICGTIFSFSHAIPALAEQHVGPQHGIAMYGSPALPPDFVALPYVNADAPKGGVYKTGNTGGFDSLNPFIRKGTTPWQLRFMAYESLMGRNWDEPFALYGLLAESVETGNDRKWVEFTLREEARFSDGSPVTVEDVIWSFETLGTKGHARYRGLHSQIDSIEQTGPRKVKFTFNVQNRELALITGLRPILKKAQWEGKDFTKSGFDVAPIGSAPYVIGEYQPNRFMSLKRNPDYWGKDLPLMQGVANFDELRIEFFGDSSVQLEAFKAGVLNVQREYNANRWRVSYDFPARTRGDVILSEFQDGKPSGITGFVINTRKDKFKDWRVREALILAFNFEFMNEVVTGGSQQRITSYFSGTELGMQHGPAEGRVKALLEPFAEDLIPGVMSGYALPEGDGNKRNRKNLKLAAALLKEAGWTVTDGILRNADGEAFEFSILLPLGAGELKAFGEIYVQALARLGITARIETVDNAQFFAREGSYDFDMTSIRRGFTLSPGNEQMTYWGHRGVEEQGSRNLMGMNVPAAEAMIETMVATDDKEEFVAAVRALDRILTAGRYVIPTFAFGTTRIAHAKELKHPEYVPVNGAGYWVAPPVWWYEE
ncbi:extracellular solute-binding protein [Lentibacter algarum]|uniref:extracellular solute-binding protein n=1 Tax=Lentibacter algarum TaxID=576131 RepID=UPI001C07B1F7|nr:extracellular solute-binding protein [Lentibacter algarum]MBU2982370.1 extracellular solute-binding protein [Lentibacter algarum]